jgi:hypothetical protein
VYLDLGRLTLSEAEVSESSLNLNITLGLGLKSREVNFVIHLIRSCVLDHLDKPGIAVGSGQQNSQPMEFILHASLLLEQACSVCSGGKPLFVTNITLTCLLSKPKAFRSPYGTGVSTCQVNFDVWLFSF